MTHVYNVYCDESGHLEHGLPSVMILGAIWCPVEKTREIMNRIREITERNGVASGFEIKWGKVSPAKVRFYLDLVDYFFDDDDLHFRALVIPDKTRLQHEQFAQTHDEWYYKMYFTMLNVIIDPKLHYRIYLDIKDTRSASKVRHLHDVLSNKNYDFSRTIIEHIQNVRSHEVMLMQLADLLIGAVSYANRGLTDNAGKVAIVERIRERSGYTLTRSTFPRESKVNIFIWKPNWGQP